MFGVKPVNLLSLNIPDFGQVEKLVYACVALLNQTFRWSQAVFGVNGVKRFNHVVQSRDYYVKVIHNFCHVLQQVAVEKGHITGNNKIVDCTGCRQTGANTNHGSLTRVGIGNYSQP